MIRAQQDHESAPLSSRPGTSDGYAAARRARVSGLPLMLSYGYCSKLSRIVLLRRDRHDNDVPPSQARILSFNSLRHRSESVCPSRGPSGEGAAVRSTCADAGPGEGHWQIKRFSTQNLSRKLACASESLDVP